MAAEMRSTTVMPAASRAATFSGLLVMRRTRVMPSWLEDRGGEFELAVVGAEAEAFVGFDGVEALVLQFVGAELGHEADAAALLLFVEQDAGALAGDEAEREVELVVAVAAEGVEDVSGEALGVDADQRRGFGVEVAHGERDGVFDGAAVGVGVEVARLGEAFEAEDAEVSPAGGEVGIGDLANGNERHNSIIDSRGREDSWGWRGQRLDAESRGRKVAKEA